MAKSLSKRLEAAAKLKGCQDIWQWIQSIVNHLYWSAISILSSQSNMILAKWESVVNHVINIHKHRHAIFPECFHGILEGVEERKKWLKIGSNE